MFARLSRIVSPLLVLAALLLAFRFVALASPPPRWTPANMVPHEVGPCYDWPAVATDEQLHAVLDRMQPAPAANTNVLVHALRLWGPRAEFHDPARPSGQEMLAYFLDDAAFRRRAGDSVPPLFYFDERGAVEVREFDPVSRFAESGSHHLDDLLATLAESGVRLDAPLTTRDGPSSVAALLTSSLERYHTRQWEYEWTAISYARYVFPQTPPVNRYGQRYDLDTLLDQVIDAPLPYGPCGGTHRLEALAVLYRIDEQVRALSPKQKRRILSHMLRVSHVLQQAQTREGFWNRRWPAGAEALKDTASNQYDKILVTGHHLEWLALAPPEVLPPRENIVRAAQWLVRAMIEEDAARLQEKYGPFSHAARALCLWRSREPYDAWREFAPRASADATSDATANDTAASEAAP